MSACSAVLDGEPTIVKLANGWVIINIGGGPTDDKPDVILEPPGVRSFSSSLPPDLGLRTSFGREPGNGLDDRREGPGFGR